MVMPCRPSTTSRRLIMALIWTLSTTTISKVHSFALRRVPAASGSIGSIRLLATSATRRSADGDAVLSSSSQQLVSEAPVITLKRSRQSKAFRNGNQLVFTRAVQSGTAPSSALVQVSVDDGPSGKNDKQAAKGGSNAQPIGWGVYNPDSLYKIRILCHRYLQPSLYKEISNNKANPETTVEDALTAILQHHLRVAVRKRNAINLPHSGENTMFRLVNGEGDGLSGLQVDVIHTHVVVQSSAAWTEVHKDVIWNALKDVLGNDYTTIIWKVAGSRLKQDGYQGIIEQDDDDDDDDTDNSEAVVALENGVKFQTFPALIGQKTGVYCDQRENRHTLSKYTKGKTVLDLCCFHGGFSLTAVLQGGATHAVGVDSSAAAVAAATENAKLNGCEDQATFLQSDISKYMQTAATDGVSYDVVVLDPPKLAPTAASLDKARRKYHGLNRDAIKLIDPTEGGILMTCTCSAAMTQKDGGQYFLEMVAGAAQAAGREVTLLSKAGAASCHTQSPVSWPAGAYLTAALFYVHPAE